MINSLRQDTGMILHMSTGPDGLVQPLLAISEKWKEQRLQQPTSISCPLRLILFRAMLEELTSRLNKLATLPPTHDMWQQARKSGLVNQDQAFLYRQWNQEKQELVPLETKPLTLSDVQFRVKTILSLLIPGVVHRFHALRPLSAKMQSQTVAFMLEIGMRSNQATHVHQHLSDLVQNSSLQLIGVQLRHATLQRSKLCQEIQQQLSQMSA